MSGNLVFSNLKYCLQLKLFMKEPDIVIVADLF